MRIYLPSNGMMSLVHIEMRNPMIKDIRELSNISENDTLRKTEFLKLLCNPEDLDKITPSDRDYLFFIAASAFSLNAFNYTVKCDCGKTVKDVLNAGEVEPIRLSYRQKNTSKKKLGGQEFTFRRLSVGMETTCIFFAMDSPEEKYDEVYTDAVVAMTLYGEVNPELIERVQKIDVSIYYYAYFYQYFLPHGADIRTVTVCPHCGKEITVLHPIKANLLSTDLKTMMQCFVSLGDKLTLEDFYNMTLPEYNLFVQTLNSKIQKD